jgi:hypothetical protein
MKYKQLFLVMTFGVASALTRGVFRTITQAKKESKSIRKTGGDPKIYRCTLIK